MPPPVELPPTPLVHHTKLSSLCSPAGAHWLPGVRMVAYTVMLPSQQAHPLLPPVWQSALYVFISLPDLSTYTPVVVRVCRCVYVLSCFSHARCSVAH